MVLIILGVLAIIIANRSLAKMHGIMPHSAVVLLSGVLCLSFASIMIGLFAPSLNGYGEFKVKETKELVPISEELTSKIKDEQDIYVVDLGQDIYFACTDPLTKGKVTEKYESTNVSIVYSDEFVIKEYKARAKLSIWSFGFFDSTTRYEICVPEDSVLKVIY